MKKCFKCKIEKPLDEFYAHPAMSDGRLGKCKECTKKDTSEREQRLRSTDANWIMKERERCRIKQEKARADGTDTKVSSEARKRWEEKNPHKKSAEGKAMRALKSGKIENKTRCEGCGKQSEELHMHHPDYTQPLFVRFLCPPYHGKEHRKPMPMF